MMWKELKGYREIYLVSDDGQVKRADRVGTRGNYCKGADLSFHENSSGYYRVRLNLSGVSKDYFVHRLVAEAFIPKEDGKNYVNHIDGNKHNNRVENLEWCTFRDNIKHAWALGIYSGEKEHQKKGESHPMHKLTEEQVKWIRTHHKRYNKEYGSKPLATRFGVSSQTITNIVNNKNWVIE